VSCSLRPVGRAHRARLEALVRGTGLFREAEVATALELLDEALDGDDDYRFLGAFDGDDLTGYACFGPTPDTLGTYDLYWIAVDRARQSKGIGTQLVQAVERTVSAGGGRLIVVETSSRADYNPTRAFYEARGFGRTATISGYYAPGDDLVIYVKDLTHGNDLAGAAP
jgi:ribosomal protein S18 acetylase RimI-like enzyme